MITLALCSSLTALAEYGWLIHQRAEEIKQECQHKILMKDFEFVKNGSTKSFWTIGWEFFIEPVLFCSQKADILFGSLSAVYLLPGYLCPNFKIYLKYNKTSYKLHWTKSKFYWAEVTVQSPTSEKLPLCYIYIYARMQVRSTALVDVVRDTGTPTPCRWWWVEIEL